MARFRESPDLDPILELKHRLADVTISDIIRAMEWDIEIALDYSRYANWLLGFATAGLGVSILSLSNQAETAIGKVPSYYMVLIAVGALISALVAGVWAKRNVLKSVPKMREQMSYIMSQRSFLLSQVDIPDTLRQMRERLQRAGYLDILRLLKEKGLEKTYTGLVSERKLIYWQEAFLAVAYMALLLASIPGPPIVSGAK